MKINNIHIILLMIWTTLCPQIIGDKVIKLIRVSFPEDQKESTTGNGNFLYIAEWDTCGSYTIDPVPHDKQYFQSQIEALNNYFTSVSYGKCRIDLQNSAVLPVGEQESYLLSQTMDYYHPYNEEELHSQRITELFIESLQLAFSTDSIEFSSDDIIVIAHAGIGQDFSLPFLDPTPEDIPSTFIDPEMLNEYNGGPVFIGKDVIDKGIIIPETQNHLLYDIAESMFASAATPCDYQYGLTGTFALMVGFALGLPPIWDTESGQSGIGIFGLMDQGSNNGRGLIPAPADAWTRVFASWEEPFMIKPGNTIKLPNRSENNLIQIDINDHEYFLVENRSNWFRQHVSIDSARYRIYEQSGNEKRYPPFIEVLFDSVDINRDVNGVVTSIPNYDLGLPATGLLIWHIDEEKIATGISDFSINNDREYRGINLEEADGAQDIGYPNIFLFTDPTGGYFGDMWFQGNSEYERLYPDFEDKPIEFGPFTFPNSKSNDGSSTFISINNIGLPNDTMTFSITNSMLANGFPDSSLHIQLVYDLDHNGTMEIIGGVDSLWIAEEGNITGKNYFYSTTNNIYDLSVGNYNGTNRLLVFETNGTSSIINYFEWNADQLEMNWVSDQYLGFVNGLFINDSTGNHQIVQVTEDIFSKAFIQNSDGSMDSVSINYSVSMADINLDGRAEYFFIEDKSAEDVPNSGWLNGYYLNDITVSGFPLNLLLSPGKPLIKNLTGDQHPEIVVQKNDGEILIVDWQGKILFRLANLGNIVCLSEYNGQNAVVTESAIWIFDEVSENFGNEWTSIHHDFGNTRILQLSISKQDPESRMMDKNKTYAYPNPAYEGNVKFRIAVESAESVEIMIYDFAGYFVKKLNLNNVSQGTIQEINWNIDNVDAGVYFANVSAKNGLKIENEILKIGVIK